MVYTISNNKSQFNLLALIAILIGSVLVSAVVINQTNSSENNVSVLLDDFVDELIKINESSEANLIMTDNVTDFDNITDSENIGEESINQTIKVNETGQIIVNDTKVPDLNESAVLIDSDSGTSEMYVDLGVGYAGSELMSTLEDNSLIKRGASWEDIDLGNGRHNLILYSGQMFMESVEGNGDYRPYTDITTFQYIDYDKLVINWWGKSIVLKIFIEKDGEYYNITNLPETVTEGSKPSKEDLNFKTEIKKNIGDYYFNHTLDDIKSGINGIGYEILKSNATCKFTEYSLICDEQEINFWQAVEEQNLTLNKIEVASVPSRIKFTCDKDCEGLGYIDPTIKLQDPDSENLEDVYTSEKDPDTNWDISTSLLIGYYSGYNELRTFLKFNISSLPTNIQINYSSLNLYSDFSVGTGHIIIFFASNGSSWTEETITWNNQPDYNSSINSTPAGASVGTYNSFNVTNIIDAKKTNDNVTLIGVSNYTGPSYHYLRFLSKETAGNKPYLNITYILPDQNKFIIKNSTGANIAWFGDLGNIVLKGILEQNSNCQGNVDDAFVVRNNNEDVLIVAQNGSMYIDGTLFENQETLNSLETSNDFRIKHNGTLVSYVNESGYLFLKGSLIENGNP